MTEPTLIRRIIGNMAEDALRHLDEFPEKERREILEHARRAGANRQS